METIFRPATGADRDVAHRLLTAQLLEHDLPADPEGIWSVWDQAKPGERRQIVEIAKTLIKTGT